MKTWIPCELHTHTLHSDGSLELQELAVQAKKLGLECIALTDHNTIAGHSEIAAAEKLSGIRIVPGFEWTTFYGHMVAMGVESYVDWRGKGPGDIHRGIDEIHRAGGLAGIAHPYRMGSPMCTGCYWEFELEDWSSADYLEVWSENFPALNPVNKRAFERWTRLLDQGHRITAVSGRDWHGSGNEREHIAVTYLGINNLECMRSFSSYRESVLAALKSGSACITMGPLLKLSVKTVYGTEYECGEEVHAGQLNAGQDDAGRADTNIADAIQSQKLELANAAVEIDFSARKGKWELDADVDKNSIRSVKIVFASNRGKLDETVLEQDEANTVSIISKQFSTIGLRWLRAEAYGSIAGHYAMIAFTNPVYF